MVLYSVHKHTIVFEVIMARKKKRKNTSNNSGVEPSLESTVKAINSLLLTPEFQSFYSSGALRGVRERMLTLNFSTIRNVVERVPIINAVINARIDQIQPYTKFAAKKNDKGFILKKTGRDQEITDKDNEAIDSLISFLYQTGFHYDSDREDDLFDFSSMAIRELLTIDQVATELQLNRKSEVTAFWLLDGATIKRVDKNQQEYPKDVRFVQEYDNRIYNTYTNDTLIFDYKNKRADIRYRGFGYSPAEMCIDLITTLLFGYNYTRDQFVRDKVPKGFISVMGDAGQPQLNAIRQYWYSAMTGAGGRWNIPILPSGKEGVGIDFKRIDTTNRDMEYHKTMMFVTSIVTAVYSMDLAELGIKSDDSTALIGESSEPRIQSSKDRGLASLLAFLEQYINKIIRKITTDYEIQFVGLEKEDATKTADLRKKEVESFRTINEVRKEEGYEELEDDYANVVLNVQAVQLYQSSQAEGEEIPDAEEGGEGLPETEEIGAQEKDVSGEPESDALGIDWDAMFKSMPENNTVSDRLQDDSVHVVIH